MDGKAAIPKRKQGGGAGTGGKADTTNPCPLGACPLTDVQGAHPVPGPEEWLRRSCPFLVMKSRPMEADVLANIPQQDQTGLASASSVDAIPSPQVVGGLSQELLPHSSDRVICIHSGPNLRVSQNASAPPAHLWVSRPWSPALPRPLQGGLSLSPRASAW